MIKFNIVEKSTLDEKSEIFHSLLLILTSWLHLGISLK